LFECNEERLRPGVRQPSAAFGRAANIRKRQPPSRRSGALARRRGGRTGAIQNLAASRNRLCVLSPQNSAKDFALAIVFQYENTNQTSQIMKTLVCLAVGLSALISNLAFAQPEPVTAQYGMPPADQIGRYVWVAQTNSLPKFDLNFPGGTPEQLVNAIEKVTDKTLNTIIPDDYKDLKIPPFSVKDVTVAQLFRALTSVSKITQRYDVIDPLTGNGGYVDRTSTYGFRTDSWPDTNSIWFFTKEGGDTGPFKVVASTICKFYQLSPYLEAGYTVDDITTAVGTGWKMLGVTNPPQISYHKDTKVLIAVGEEDKVNLVGDVLKQLSQGKSKGKSADNQAEKSGK
jgi:hypothetical protein